MNIQTYFSHSTIIERDVKEASIVVIDVLRASSTIICALMSQAEKVIPLRDVNEAVAVARSMGPEIALLAGELDAIKIPDFNMDNSPHDFKSADFTKKAIVLRTSNGTEALYKVRNSSPVFIGGMLNKTAVASVLAKLNKDVIFVCSGTNGRTSVDDLYCAGAIVSTLRSMVPSIRLSDSTLICEFLNAQPDGFNLVRQSAHYKRLVELKREDDIKLCFSEDLTDIVPIYAEGKIIKYGK